MQMLELVYAPFTFVVLPLHFANELKQKYGECSSLLLYLACACYCVDSVSTKEEKVTGMTQGRETELNNKKSKGPEDGREASSVAGNVKI